MIMVMMKEVNERSEEYTYTFQPTALDGLQSSLYPCQVLIIAWPCIGSCELVDVNSCCPDIDSSSIRHETSAVIRMSVPSIAPKAFIWTQHSDPAVAFGRNDVVRYTDLGHGVCL